MGAIESRSVPGGALLRLGRVSVLVTDRTGVSPPRNLTYVSGSADAVTAARDWAAAVVGAVRDSQVWCRQVHASTVGLVTPGMAGPADADPVPDTDALVCRLPGVACGVLVADCAPVLLACDDAFAVVHVGWRGLVSSVVTNALDVLEDVTGETSTPVVAVLGPSIGPCCFEVGEDVAAEFEAISPGTVRVGESGRPHADLRSAIECVLGARGVVVAAPSPTVSFGCTRCEERWYSHRRGDPERQAMLAALDPGVRG